MVCELAPNAHAIAIALRIPTGNPTAKPTAKPTAIRRPEARLSLSGGRGAPPVRRLLGLT